MPVKPPSFRPAYLPSPKERTRDYDRERGSPSSRGYGRAWQKARNAFLGQHPLCVVCGDEGQVTPATEVDHKIPHGGDPVLFWDESNWQSLCTPHHSAKTRADNVRKGGVYKSPGIGGVYRRDPPRKFPRNSRNKSSHKD